MRALGIVSGPRAPESQPPTSAARPDFTAVIARLEALLPVGRTVAAAPPFYLPEDAHPMAKRGVELARALERREAHRAFRQALADDKTALAVWCCLAEVAVAEQRWEEALVIFELCAKSDPQVTDPSSARMKELVAVALQVLKAA